MKQEPKVIRDEIAAVVQFIQQALEKEDGDELLELGTDLESTAKKVAKAWSGSWLGYHARVYYAHLQAPPPGAYFDRQWGLSEDSPFTTTRGEWGIYNADDLRDEICRMAGIDDIDSIWIGVKALKAAFEDAKDQVLSCFFAYAEFKKDDFMKRLQSEVENTTTPNTQNFFDHLRPKGQLVSSDFQALTEGVSAPPHIVVMSQALEIKACVLTLRDLSKLCLKAAAHIDKFSFMSSDKNSLPKKIFLGHGRSHLWRELKDFIQDRLHLQWDEFNRVSPAGLTTISRLETMLQEASFAFLIMTAEDEQNDEKLHPRLNVVHETGLFQGRLGFTRSIILLEEGCVEFSNIIGLSQIRFPKGNIRACFEEVRQVLERERLLQ